MVDVTAKEQKDKIWFQVLASAVACLASFSDGFLQAWSSPFIVKIVNDSDTYNITQNEASYFAILPSISMMVSCFGFALLCDKIGRKTTLMLTAIPQIAAWILTIFADNVYMFYLSRLLSGCATGCLFTTMPAYVGEVVSPKIRGLASTFLATFSFVGQFLINVIGSYYSVRTSALICLPSPVIFLICFYFMPESPYFLIMHGRYEEAKDTLMILTRKKNVSNDFEHLREVVEKQMEERGRWIDLVINPTNRRAALLGIFLRASQMFGGMAVYTTSSLFIFEKSSEFLPSHVASMIFMSSTFIFYFAAGFLIDHYGRRTAYIMSPGLCGVFTLLESIYFYLDRSHNEIDLSAFNWFPLVGLMLCVASGSLGQSSIPTVMTAELFSTSIKAKGTTFMACMFGVHMTLCNALFYFVYGLVGLCGPFFIFACVNMLTIFITYFWLPETKGRTLDEIQQMLKAKKMKWQDVLEQRRVSNQVVTIL